MTDSKRKNTKYVHYESGLIMQHDQISGFYIIRNVCWELQIKTLEFRNVTITGHTVEFMEFSLLNGP